MSRSEARFPPCGPASTTRQATTRPPLEDWVILAPGQRWAADTLPLLASPPSGPPGPLFLLRTPRGQLVRRRKAGEVCGAVGGEAREQVGRAESGSRQKKTWSLWSSGSSVKPTTWEQLRPPPPWQAQPTTRHRKSPNVCALKCGRVVSAPRGGCPPELWWL